MWAMWALFVPAAGWVPYLIGATFMGAIWFASTLIF